MFLAPFRTKVLFRGTLERFTHISRTPVIKRSFCTRKPTTEEFEKAYEDVKRSIKDLEQPGVDYKEVLPKQREEFIEDYTKLYNYFANPAVSAKDVYPNEFYDLPENKRKAVAEFLEKQRAVYFTILDKYGQDGVPGICRINAILQEDAAPIGTPIRVAITGAAGAIGYAIAFRIASGGLFGPKTPVILRLLEIPQALNSLKGVQMELLDCAFPTLREIVTTDIPEKAFEGVDYALLIGAQPRTAGMERGDLLMKNAEIFATQGKALRNAKGSDTRVVVVGNPANTNALIASYHASGSVPPENFIAMTRLDHNRGLAKIAEKANCSLDDISRFIIWGNHSATQFPDLYHTLIKSDLALDVIKDDNWYNSTFIPSVQQRGAEIIKARGASSAASAASSCIDTVFDWHFGTNANWISAAVCSKGEYGVTEGLYYSYPVVFNDQKQWGIVRDLPIDQFSAEKMEETHKELLQERDGVASYLTK